MSLDRVFLAVESHDLPQADKIIIRVSSFPKLSDGYFWMTKFVVVPKKLVGSWQFGKIGVWSILSFKICKIEK